MILNPEEYPTREELHDWVIDHPEQGPIEDIMCDYDMLIDDELLDGSKLHTAVFMAWLQVIKEDIDGTISPKLKQQLYGGL